MNRFDLIVVATVLTLAAAIVLTVWRGDRVGIQVIDVNPPPQSENVSTAAQISIRFDQPVTVPDDSIVVTVEPDVDAEIRAERDSLILAPRFGLAPSTAYTVTLFPGVRGQRNRELLEPITWQFVTASPQIVFIQLDENDRQQLAKIPFNLTRAGDLIPAQGLPLSSTTGGVYDFAVNPQTGDIAYSVLTETGTANIEMISTNGTVSSSLVSCPQAACTNPAFSPDGELLAFVLRSASEFSAAIMSPPRLWLMHLAGGEQAALFQEGQQLGFAPAWSADGQWLSYFAPGLGGVGVYNIEGGSEDFFPTRTGDPGAWHSTQPILAITEMVESEQGTEIHLTAIDPLSGQKTNLSLSEYPIDDDAPAWSPNGEWMAFRRKELAGPRASLGKQIWLAKGDGTEARPLTANPGFDHGPPDWSPDGRYLVYHRLPLKGPEIVLSVWVADTQTEHKWEVAIPGQRPQWLP